MYQPVDELTFESKSIEMQSQILLIQDVWNIDFSEEENWRMNELMTSFADLVATL